MPAPRSAAYSGPGCPACSAVLPPEEWREGMQGCRACGATFDALVFAPRPEPGQLPLPVASGEAVATPCANHAGNRAESSCGRCGLFICRVCRVDIDGHSLCPACFDRLGAEGALPSVVSVRRNWCGMSLHLSFMSLIPFFGFLFGPAAIWAACLGLRHNRRSGERLSHAAGWVGLAAGCIGLLISLGITATLIATTRGR